jgi:hypothetical protein
MDLNMTILLDVPFEKKDDAKKNKCKWNNEAKMWYVKFRTSDRDDYFNNKFIKEYEVVKLKTSFDDKSFVKANGGKWNQYLKTWYTNRSNEALKDYFIICPLSNTF